MSVFQRRVLYGLLAASGFILIIPFAIESRRMTALTTFDVWDPATTAQFGDYFGLAALAFLGLILATGFLYAALSVGHPRAWVASGEPPSCPRCGVEVGRGDRSCPGCDQRFSR